MAGVTYVKFKEAIGKITFILITIIVFLSYKVLKGNSTDEHIGILILAFLYLIALRSFYFTAYKMLKDPKIRMNSTQKIIYDLSLIIGLGFFVLYLFAYKGVYGIYQLFSSFSWFLLILRIVIIIISGKLALAVATLQDALKWLSNETWIHFDINNK
jgi:hypothetical protein